MEKIPLVAAVLICSFCAAQPKSNFTGKAFWAFHVPNTTETSKWYEDVFQLKLMKEIKFDGGHIRIIGNDELTIEILSMKDSKSLADCALTQEDAHKLRGFFKVGFYVKDIQEAERYFKSKGVKIEHETFDDEETRSRSFILADLNQNSIQVLQNK
jgi:hypothetical protein